MALAHARGSTKILHAPRKLRHAGKRAKCCLPVFLSRPPVCVSPSVCCIQKVKTPTRHTSRVLEAVKRQHPWPCCAVDWIVLSFQVAFNFFSFFATGLRGGRWSHGSPKRCFSCWKWSLTAGFDLNLQHSRRWRRPYRNGRFFLAEFVEAK